MRTVIEEIRNSRKVIGHVPVSVYDSIPDALKELGGEECLRLLNKQVKFDAHVDARIKLGRKRKR